MFSTANLPTHLARILPKLLSHFALHPLPFPYLTHACRHAGAGIDGGAATCLQLSPGGGISFLCRECGRPGYQPFANASAISFWIRSNSNSTDPFVSSTPSDQVRCPHVAAGYKVPGVEENAMQEETEHVSINTDCKVTAIGCVILTACL